MLLAMEIHEQERSRRSWDLPLLFASVAYSVTTTLLVAIPCLMSERQLETSVGAMIAVAGWVALNATLVGLVYWRTRTRRSWFLRAVFVALGVWSAGVLILQGTALKPTYYTVGYSGAFVWMMFPIESASNTGGLPFLPSGRSALEYEWGKFTAMAIAAAIFESALAALALLIYFGALAASVRQLRPGYCEYCGYDIRASMQMGRCPECGRTIDMTIHGSVQN